MDSPIPFSQLSAHHFQTPVALLLEGIGDNILMLPAVRALAHLLEGRLKLIGHEDAFDLFFSDLPLQSRIGISRFWRDKGESTYDVTALPERIGGCDAFFSFNRSLTTSTKQLIRVLKPSLTVGFFEGFDLRIPFARDIHAVDLAFKLPLLFSPNLVPESFAAPMALPQSASEVAAQMRSALPKGTKLLAVHIETSREKAWSPIALAAALKPFLSKYTHVAAIMLELQPATAHEAPIGVVSAAGLPLAVALAIASTADIFLGVDSCMLHAADLSRVPGVALFGPTTPSEFGYRFACGAHVSSRGPMSEITPTAVVAALECVAASLFS